MESILKYRKILIIAFIMIIIAAYVFMVTIPQILSISSLKDEIKTIKSKYELSTIYEKKLGSMDGEKNVLAQKLGKIRLLYPPNILKSDIYTLFNKLSESSGVKFTNLNIIEAKEIMRDSKDNTGQSLEKVDITDTKVREVWQGLGFSLPESDSSVSKVLDSTSNIADGKPYILSVQLKSLGTDAQYKKFFSQLADIPGRINLKKFDATVGKDGELSASFSVEFYGIKDSAANFQGYFPEGASKTSSVLGKSSIFIPYDESAAKENESLQERDKVVYDFTMRIMPYKNSMATPSLSFAARNLVSGNKAPLISGDNANVENSELYLSESNGRYYCKYKTQNEAFPDRNYSDLAEFKPYGSLITVGIDSAKRISDSDGSGVLLKIFNKTSKPVSVEVLNDDINARRVTIEKGSGDIAVVYN